MGGPPSCEMSAAVASQCSHARQLRHESSPDVAQLGHVGYHPGWSRSRQPIAPYVCRTSSAIPAMAG